MNSSIKLPRLAIKTEKQEIGKFFSPTHILIISETSMEIHNVNEIFHIINIHKTLN